MVNLAIEVEDTILLHWKEGTLWAVFVREY